MGLNRLIVSPDSSFSKRKHCLFLNCDLAGRQRQSMTANYREEDTLRATGGVCVCVTCDTQARQ